MADSLHPPVGPRPASGAKREVFVGMATLADVAREAGVSIATASRVLNGSARKVAEVYRERVLVAASRLNYTANLAAQATARGMTATVTLLVPDIADPYFSMITAGVSEAAHEAGLVTIVAVTHRDGAREVELVRTLRGQRPQVLVLAGSREVDRARQSELDQELEAYVGLGGMPVFISQSSTAYPTLDFRNRESARLLAAALVDLGYRSILVLGGPQHLLTSRDRLAGFREGAGGRDVAIPAERVVECELSRDGGHDAVLALPEEVLAGIDLVFAISDVIAIGAMTALRARGLEIPRDVSVAGFDDVPGAQDTLPPLTTVRLPLVAAGRTAVRIALGLEAPPELPPGEVVLRGSTPGRG
jgi:LacI family transcriptional regulator